MDRLERFGRVMQLLLLLLMRVARFAATGFARRRRHDHTGQVRARHLDGFLVGRASGRVQVLRRRRRRRLDTVVGRRCGPQEESRSIGWTATNWLVDVRNRVPGVRLRVVQLIRVGRRGSGQVARAVWIAGGAATERDRLDKEWKLH